MKRKLDQDQNEEKTNKKKKPNDRLPNPNNKRSFPKRKVIMIVGYIGAKFHGLQRNPGVETIEGVLENALSDIGVISEENRGSFNKVNWSTCARTDRGVSAVANMITLKALMVPDIVEKVNEKLPEDIRVFQVRRVTNGFSPRKRCSSRVYQYLIPTYCFDPNLKLVDGEIKFNADFKFTPELIQKINETFAQYEGTNNFHNFTKRISYDDKTSLRYIISIKCSDPIMMDDIEWTNITIEGQSFMLHQIRKMVNLVVNIIRNNQSKYIINSCFQKPKKEIPKAPALGLFLNKISFTAYNEFAQNNPHGPISYDDINNQLDNFMNNKIVPHITATEKKDKEFITYLKYLEEKPMNFEYMKKTVIDEEEEKKYWLKKQNKTKQNDREESDDG